LLLVDPDPTPAGREATARLQAIDVEVRSLLGERLQAEEVENLAVADRDAWSTSLRLRLMRIRDFAAAAAARLGNPAVRLPGRLRESSARALAESAHMMVDAGAERLTVLVSFGMPATLLEDAGGDLAALEDALGRRAGAIGRTGEGRREKGEGNRWYAVVASAPRSPFPHSPVLPYITALTASGAPP
jgi:hypothetical protein